MERLRYGVELLDGPLDDPDALAGNLRDLRRINRLLGGVRASAAAIEALAAHRAELTLLDVGTGGADIPLALVGSSERGRRIDIVGIDSRPEIVAAARSAAAEASVTVDRLDIQLGDGRSIPYPDRSFDIAHASLLVHHLEPEAAVEVLAEMARVARLGVIVNDLDRTRLGWLGAWLMGHLLTENRYTRRDAPLSVRRAYRADEVADLLRRAGLVPVSTVRAAFGQRYAIAAVPRSSLEPDPQRGIGVGE
jgi:ubiquinone/menaquinone biosynthesis C-methylase UbiE